MTVVLNLPHSQPASPERPSHGYPNPGRSHPGHSARVAPIKEKVHQSEHEAKMRVFGFLLSANLREEALTVVTHPSTALSTLVVMDTGVRVMDSSRNASVPLQARFDLSRQKIELVSGNSIVDFDLRRYAPRVKMLLAKMEALLLEENRLGGDLRSGIDKEVAAGVLPEGMKPSSISSPAKLWTGGYEFEVVVMRSMNRSDGTEIPSTVRVALKTNEKGLPLGFVSSVVTSERAVTGSRVFSLAGSSFLSGQSVQRTLREQLQQIFPKEYQSMGLR